MADTFKDILPSITTTKKYVLEEEKDYLPFLVNRALSYYDHGIFYANQMNMCSGLDKKLQYDYLINSIRAKKSHFVKWAKPIKSDDLDAVKTYFHYSDSKAAEVLKILNDDQLAFIRKETKIGE